LRLNRKEQKRSSAANEHKASAFGTLEGHGKGSDYLELKGGGSVRSPLRDNFFVKTSHCTISYSKGTGANRAQSVGVLYVPIFGWAQGNAMFTSRILS
jgi:hypothetical protein